MVHVTKNQKAFKNRFPSDRTSFRAPGATGSVPWRAAASSVARPLWNRDTEKTGHEPSVGVNVDSNYVDGTKMHKLLLLYIASSDGHRMS